MLGLEKVADCTCNEHKIVGREVGAAGATSVSERWTVDRCGTILRYTITFTDSPSGGTLIALDPVPQVVQKKPDSPVPTLPKEFDDVWYRAGNRGFAIPAYSASGKLLVTEQRVVFGDGAGAIEIGVNEIKSVCWGKMAPDIRTAPTHFLLFEKMINLIHEHAPKLASASIRSPAIRQRR